jgi:hypothetical protein
MHIGNNEAPTPRSLPVVDPDLRFLGERLERVQAELRDLRGVKGEVARLNAELARVEGSLSDRIDALERSTNIRFDALERSTSSRFDALERSIDARFNAVDARFAQVHETMTTNLAVVLEAIKGLSRA